MQNGQRRRFKEASTRGLENRSIDNRGGDLNNQRLTKRFPYTRLERISHDDHVWLVP